MMKSIEKLVQMGLFLVAAILSVSAVYADDFEGSETSLVEAFKAEGANAFDLDSNEIAFGLVNAPEGILVVLTRPPSKRTLELLRDRRVLDIEMTTAIDDSGKVLQEVNSKLRSLTILVPEVSTTPIDLGRFESLPSLQIRGEGLTDHFVSSATFPANLASLSLESDFLTEKSYTWVLAASENLESLRLSSAALTSIDPEPVRSHKKLVVLNIPKTAITFSVTETLFTSSVLDRITTRGYVVLRRR